MEILVNKICIYSTGDNYNKIAMSMLYLFYNKNRELQFMFLHNLRTARFQYVPLNI